MFIELEFCGMTKVMEVPEQILEHVELDWVPPLILPLIELNEGIKSETVGQVRLIFETFHNRNEHNYLVYHLTKINKIG